MAISRVDYDGKTLIDLTGDSVTPESLLSGYNAHDKTGKLINGVVVIPQKISELENDEGYAPVEMCTQAEYDALPDSKLTDGVLYFITDGRSEEEKIVIEFIGSRNYDELVLNANVDPNTIYFVKETKPNVLDFSGAEGLGSGLVPIDDSKGYIAKNNIIYGDSRYWGVNNSKKCPTLMLTKISNPTKQWHIAGVFPIIAGSSYMSLATFAISNGENANKQGIINVKVSVRNGTFVKNESFAAIIIGGKEFANSSYCLCEYNNCIVFAVKLLDSKMSISLLSSSCEAEDKLVVFEQGVKEKDGDFTGPSNVLWSGVYDITNKADTRIDYLYNGNFNANVMASGRIIYLTSGVKAKNIPEEVVGNDFGISQTPIGFNTSRQEIVGASDILGEKWERYMGNNYTPKTDWMKLKKQVLKRCTNSIEGGGVTKPYLVVCAFDGLTGGMSTSCLISCVSNDNDLHGSGLLELSIVMSSNRDPEEPLSPISAYARWLATSGTLDPSKFVLQWRNETVEDKETITARLWLKMTEANESWDFEIISAKEPDSVLLGWKMFDYSGEDGKYSGMGEGEMFESKLPKENFVVYPEETIGIPTPAEGTIEVFNGFISKRNGIVHFTMYCKILKNLREEEIIFTLQEGWKPKLYYYSANFGYIANLYDSVLGKQYPFIKLEPNGAFHIFAQKDDYLMIDTTYIPAYN